MRQQPASTFDIPGANPLPICLERTLDESYFPGMNDDFFETRNRDQVV
jgi:hypothetical protein